MIPLLIYNQKYHTYLQIINKIYKKNLKVVPTQHMLVYILSVLYVISMLMLIDMKLLNLFLFLILLTGFCLKFMIIYMLIIFK